MASVKRVYDSQIVFFQQKVCKMNCKIKVQMGSYLADKPVMYCHTFIFHRFCTAEQDCFLVVANIDQASELRHSWQLVIICIVVDGYRKRL